MALAHIIAHTQRAGEGVHASAPERSRAERDKLRVHVIDRTQNERNCVHTRTREIACARARIELKMVRSIQINQKAKNETRFQVVENSLVYLF